MSKVESRNVGKNQIWWLSEGDGGHGSEPRPPDDVIESLRGCFAFAEEADGRPGLRSPQLGALHAVLAHRSTNPDEPITIVMPTGTGKTETMLAAFAHTPARTLVIVPSDALRTQIAEKFATLGVLPTAGAVSGHFLCPVIGLLRSSLKTPQDASELLEQCNVIVATTAAVTGSSKAALKRLVDRTEQLFVDEAHHVAARTWRAIADQFAGKSVVQFTATPFREDGKHLGGRIAYAYPLRLAQEKRYFSRIRYRSVSELGDPDGAVSAGAVAQLREDLEHGFDHVLMARVQSIPRALEVLDRYKEVAADLNPIRLDSRMSKRDQRSAYNLLRERATRVIVCVDMLGEGFDLPSLKIAAIHDPHKSLAVTLQFVGRFARVGGEDLGEASVFVPRHAGDVDDRLRKLYGEDSDWNIIIRDLTQAEVDRERARSDFETSFGAVPNEIALRSLQPKMSTVVYRGDHLDWNANGVYRVFPEEALLTQQIAINEQNHVIWFVTEERMPVPWGDFSTFGEVVHHLYVIHAEPESGLLYINSSNNDSLHEAVAKAVGGAGMALVRGDVVYRVLAPIARRVPTNVGLIDAVNRNRRFTMHVGADVLEGFGPGAAQKSKTNIYAYGYADGRRVSFGASRKGRVWSHSVAYNLIDWVKWVESVGAVLTDESISIQSVMEGFIIPQAATSRPQLIPLGIEWPYHLIGNTSEARQVEHDGVPVPLLDLDLAITAWTTDQPIEFEVRSDAWSLRYQITFGDDGPSVSALEQDARIVLKKGPVGLARFMTDNGMTVFFEKEALLSPDGYLLQPDRDRPRFDPSLLESIDWTGVNLRKESQGPSRDADSVQHRVIQTLSAETDWELVIDDDGTGEVADVVFVRRHDHVLDVLIAHCKFSSEEIPGARLEDLYEVCGQAQKSFKARSEIELVLRKLLRRERLRQQRGVTGFIQGDADLLRSILNEARLLDVNITIVIAQPGLSATKLNIALSELLGCTALYLEDTYNSRLRVLCSA